MKTEKEFDFFCMKDIVDDFLPKIGKDPWQTVFWKDAGPYYRDEDQFLVWCALMTPDAATEVIQRGDYYFDLDFGPSGPFVGETGDEIFYESSHSQPIKPFVLYEQEEGLCEEFRLYHACKFNLKRDRLTIEDESGNPIEIAKIEGNRIQVHLKYLKSFLAISQLHLAIYIECVRFSNNASICQLEASEEIGEVNDFRWRRIIAKGLGGTHKKMFSRFNGKIIIKPNSQRDAYERKYKSDVKREDVEFIIGVDENGEDITFGCNPKNLANDFGANCNNPRFLTHVHFKKQVLDKYYDEPERYSVEQGYIRCGGHWLLKADIDHPDKVIVFLGDLYILPYEEMSHWRSFNILPEGGISHSYFKNSFECDPTDAKVADLHFRKLYTDFKRQWKEKHGFSPFKEPSEDDSGLLQTLQIPSTNAQKAFDEQVLILTKLLIDLINVKEIDKRFNSSKKDVTSIDKFEKLLGIYPNAPKAIEFLRALQKLRSKGAAHSKGSSYKKAMEEMNISLDNKPKAFESILNRAIYLLEGILKHFC